MQNSPQIPTIPGFDLLSVLGSNNATAVYKAREIKFNRLVALKVVQSAGDVGANRRIWREAQTMAYCTHRTTLSPYEVNEINGRAFLSMELAEGGTAADRLSASRSPRETAQIVESVAQAVAHGHGLGMVHRAVNLSHIFICSDRRFKLGGFASAAFGHELGPIEMGKCVAGDIHGLGVVCYELLTGRPLSNTNVFQLPSSVDSELAEICLGSLGQHPTRRFDTAATVAEALTKWLRTAPQT